MKRRNAETGKLRRPLKRTKITEGMYGNSMLYVKFIMLWSSIALADYMLEFRFEFLWPLWLMIKAIYHSYYCKGLTFTVFFTCIALTSDLTCYFFIPMQLLTYLAGVYVWVYSIWNTFESKGVCCGQMVLMWVVVVYVEALRTGVLSALDQPAGADWPAKPWAASALGYPIVSLGAEVKQYVDEKLRLRTQRQVREQNEFYFRLMREALPEGGLVSSTYCSELPGEPEGGGELRQNGSAKRRWKPDTNGHCVRDKEHVSLRAKLEHLEQYVERRKRVRDSSTHSTQSQKSTSSVHTSVQTSVQSSTQPSPHAGHSNGVAKGPGCHTEQKGRAKYNKYDKNEATPLIEDRRRKKHRDLDKENIDSPKSKENTKEHIDKDVESTKEVKVKECNNVHKEEKGREDERKRVKEEEKQKEQERKRVKEEEKKKEEERKRVKEEEKKKEEERKWVKEEERKRELEEKRRREKEEERRKEKERERELKEKEKEKEKERERERELEQARECVAEAVRLRGLLAAAARGEAECARQLAAARAADKLRRAAHADLKHQLHHKMSTWRSGERAALERKLGEEKRLRLAAEQQLHKARRTPQGECESDWCKSRRALAEAETQTLRTDLERTRDRLAQAQRDLNQTTEQVAALEAEKIVCTTNVGVQNDVAFHALQDRALHLERVLSAETRVKLDLLSALGDANRKMHIQESVINSQEKKLEELKAQMLAVMPTEFISSSPSTVSKMRLSEGSPLDPNATVYTPKQLCLDA